ncbi:MAG: AmmeMemoRadiSam system protein A [Candidatus Acidiferrum sp.]
MLFHSETERRSLLELARRAISEAVSHEKLAQAIPRGGVFDEKRGAFVTLQVRGRLRGCIGNVEAFEPLGQAVARCAVNAGLHDPRFSPVSTEDLRELQIEISLLSSLEPILPDSIEVGKHGLLVTQGTKRGLLLPQVAVEHKLAREQFLEETCRKAGLPANAWLESETRIYGFVCEVFAENGNDRSEAVPNA